MDVVVARSVADVDGWLARAVPTSFVAVDTETTGMDPWRSRIRSIQLAVGPDQPVLVVDTDRLSSGVVAQLLDDTGVLKVFHNAAFDLRMLWQAGLDVRRVADTMLAQQLLDGVSATPVGASLQAIARVRLGVELDKSVVASFGDAALGDAQIRYAAEDARVTWDIFAQQHRELEAQGMVAVARCEFEATVALAAMQLRGIGIDGESWRRVLSVTERRLPDLRAAAQLALVSDRSPQTLFGPEPVNLDSPEQLLAALARLGVTVDSTREAVLRDHTDNPAVTAVLAYRQAAKVVSNWGGDWIDRTCHPVTGRIHAHVQQIVGTGRMAHSDPNLTQIPAEPAYRGCFVPAPGNHLVVADYSQQELRVLAAVSGDQALARVFTSGADLHVQTAATVFGVLPDQVSAAQRKAAKALNFGLMYGMGAAGFARATGTDVDQARQTMQTYFAAFPDVAAWLRRIESQARRTHRVNTPLGRGRYVSDGGTFARNAPIQGAGADMTKLALAGVDRVMKKQFAITPQGPVGPVLTVHDELVVEVRRDDAEAAAGLIRAEMLAAAEVILGAVPAKVDVQIGLSWAA
ncbi:bifunctional 3'-5' exonuclease/DNA polymerase [soil metagenome]